MKILKLKSDKSDSKRILIYLSGVGFRIWKDDEDTEENVLGSILIMDKKKLIKLKNQIEKDIQDE